MPGEWVWGVPPSGTLPVPPQLPLPVFAAVGATVAQSGPGIAGCSLSGELWVEWKWGWGVDPWRRACPLAPRSHPDGVSCVLSSSMCDLCPRQAAPSQPPTPRCGLTQIGERDPAVQPGGERAFVPLWAAHGSPARRIGQGLAKRGALGNGCMGLVLRAPALRSWGLGLATALRWVGAAGDAMGGGDGLSPFRFPCT